MVPQRHAQTRIGLLGGSFNPPHAGHREISLAALEWLKIDCVWWLVSPANPLKSPGMYAPYEERLWRSRQIANHHSIIVSNFEERRGLQYTVDTLEALQSLWPQVRFVWLMGADSFANFHLWRDWRRIASLVPIAIFSRPGHEDAPESEAGKAFAAFRMSEEEGPKLADCDPPAWAFWPKTANPLSSTALRTWI